MKLQVKLFEHIDNDNIYRVNNFLEEHGNNVVSVNATPRGSSNQYTNYSIVYKDMSKSSFAVKFESSYSKANNAIKELGSNFIDLEIREKEYSTGYYIKYYKVDKNKDDETNTSEKALG